MQLTGIVRMGGGLFRGKISDKETRMELFSVTNRLKGSQEFSSIFVQRDLTYIQRQEVIAKRRSRGGIRLGRSEGPTPEQQSVGSQNSQHVNEVRSLAQSNSLADTYCRDQSVVTDSSWRGARGGGRTAGGRGRPLSRTYQRRNLN